jgi:hypothetical protein
MSDAIGDAARVQCPRLRVVRVERLAGQHEPAAVGAGLSVGVRQHLRSSCLMLGTEAAGGRVGSALGFCRVLWAVRLADDWG